MKSVLVDTSVWVKHFRAFDHALTELLAQDRVLVHPFVIAEIACGSPPKREQTLSDLQTLQLVQQASIGETLDFIDKERLFGLGCGLIDLTLLTSTLITSGAFLWTLDKRLSALSSRFNICYNPVLH